MHIEVIDIKPQYNRGNLKAFAIVQFGDLKIRGMRIVQQEGQRAYVSWPIEETAAGKFWPYISSPKQVKAPLEKAILEAWHDKI